MSLRFGFLLSCLLWTPANLVFALCHEWGPAVAIGSLDRKNLPEASGMAFSVTSKGRLYHVNDSGDSARFFITDDKGKSLQTVSLENYEPIDIEDLTTGWCDSNKKEGCLFLGDIGDNKSTRSFISVLVVKEQESFNASVAIDAILTLKYPDGPHNAESMAIHPNGDIFIVTKGLPTTLYRLPYSQWSQFKPEPITLERIAEFSFLGKTSLGAADEADAQGVAYATGMSMTRDGKAFTLLTYLNALVYNIDLSTIQPGSKLNNRQLRSKNLLFTADLKTLRQQEAITFGDDGRFLLYSSEAKKADEPLMRVNCLKWDSQQ